VSDSGPLWAHSPNKKNVWHSLADHLRGTADLAAQFADPFGGGDVARWLGLLHDAGKASCAWQEGLVAAASSGRSVGIDHKALGTRLAMERGLGGFALAIFGHHGGLIDAPALRGQLRTRLDKNRGNIADAEAAIARLIPELLSDRQVALPDAWRSDPLVAEVAVRLVFSALCDADFLDTAAHFDALPAPRVRPGVDFGHLRDHFENERTALLGERHASTTVDHLRDDVYRVCVDAAKSRPGIFRLAAPTGAGKTLASAGFALHHAAAHGLRRVIVAVPFLTITEQNAEVYRRLLDGADPEPVVLEHHSGVDLDAGGRAHRWARLAAENWDAPFVVTTFVRLFESLFARKPAAMRRLHRLSGAVVVLDEVQALPHHVLVPILDGLRLLVSQFDTTVLLSSATQPDFWHLTPFKTLDAVDLIPDAQRLVSDLRRVRFEWRLNPRPTLATIANEAAAEAAAMVVVNTTADAQTVFDQWRDLPAGVAWHLSTRMCPEHRRRVLRVVRDRLKRNEPILLVSTQLIEAGVDVDFPVVYRALAPADSLLQAAGRANREGRLHQLGRVVIFAPEDGGQPPSYKTLVGNTNVYFGPGKADPDDLRALQSYYRAVYGSLNLNDPGHQGQRIQQARRRWEFETVSDGPLNAETNTRDYRQAFRLIDSVGIAIVTPQGADDQDTRAVLEETINRVRTAPVPEMAELRRLQAFTTSLHVSVLKRPGVAALMRPILGAQVVAGALVEWTGGYDSATGIDIDPRVEEFLL
jgi:CRISPR-associated endonuclease/helicase Cas3